MKYAVPELSLLMSPATRHASTTADHELESRRQWEDSKLVNRYSEAFSPFGDYWRMVLVNPVILQLAVDVAAGFDVETCSTAYAGLSTQRQWLTNKTRRVREGSTRNDPEHLLEWHRSPTFMASNGESWLDRIEKAPADALDNVSILDLGCGEGYLGRWLTGFGARYIGLEGSVRMVQMAKRKIKEIADKKRRIDIHVADLAGREDPFHVLPKRFAPDLVTAVIVFDHLPKPQTLLDRLHRFIARSGQNTPTLVVTLNPGHFLEGAIHQCFIQSDNENENSAIGVRAEADIASAGCRVSVFFRSLEQWEVAFHASGFDVVWTAPLYFNPESLPPSYAAGGADKGIYLDSHPFQAWLLYPRLRGKQPTIDEMEKAFSFGLLQRVEPDDAAQLSDAAESLEVVKYAPHETVLFAGTLGGDMNFVMEGNPEVISTAVASRKKSGGTEAIKGVVKQRFDPGDIFGELEAVTLPSGGSRSARGKIYLTRRYPFSVRAGPTGCKLLRIPCSIWDSLISNHHGNECVAGDCRASLAHLLFEQLRSNLLENAWSYFATAEQGKKIGANRGVRFSGFSNKETDSKLSKTARVIMQAATLEAGQNRETDGSIIFSGAEELATLADAEVDNTIKPSLILLKKIGAIDYVYFNDMPKEIISTDVFPWWLDVISRSFERLILVPLMGNESARIEERRNFIFDHILQPSLKENLKTEIMGFPKGPQRGQKTQSSSITLRKEFVGVADQIDRVLKNTGNRSPQELAKLIQHWLGNLGYVHQYIITSGSRGIFRIVDPHLLRAIALSPADIIEEVIHRISAFMGSEFKNEKDQKCVVIEINKQDAMLEYWERNRATGCLSRHLALIGHFLDVVWRVDPETGYFSNVDMTGASYLPERKPVGWRPVEDFISAVDH